MNFRNLISSAVICLTLAGLQSCIKGALEGDWDNNDYPQWPAVTIDAYVVDMDSRRELPGIEVTMTSHSARQPDVIKESATAVTDGEGCCFITIPYNTPGDFFRLKATDPSGRYPSKGIDYIAWSGRNNFLGYQMILMQTAK